MNVSPISNNQQNFKGTVYFKNATMIIGREHGKLIGERVKHVCVESKGKSITGINPEFLITEYDRRTEYKNKPCTLIGNGDIGSYIVDISPDKVLTARISADRALFVNREEGDGTLWYINKDGKTSCTLFTPNVSSDEKLPNLYQFPADAL